MAQERFGSIKLAWRLRKPLAVVALGATLGIAAANHKGTPGGGHNADPTPRVSTGATGKAAQPPAFDAAAGKYNKARSNGVVDCHLKLVRHGGTLIVDATLDPAVHGAWMTYDLTSQRGSTEGLSTGEDATIANAGNVMDGKFARLHAAEHFPYGDHMVITECSADIPASS